MINRYLFLSITILLLPPISSQARLGETERQCIMRYGSAQIPSKFSPAEKIIIPGRTHATYHYQDWVIRVVFVGGKSVAQEYRKKVQHPTGTRIQELEQKAILEAEMEGGHWTRSLTHPLRKTQPSGLVAGALLGEQHWKRDDGAYASLTPMSQSMLLYSKEGIDAALRAEAMKEKAQKEGVPKF